VKNETMGDKTQGGRKSFLSASTREEKPLVQKTEK
jgi:hypothetical protein